MKERWKAIPGWEDLYEVSNLGNVKSLPRRVPHSTNSSGFQTVRGGLRKLTLGKNGYPCVSLSYNGKTKLEYVHVLVLLAFRGPPQEEQLARHLDGVRHNCRLANLKWGTPLENSLDSIRHGTSVRPTTAGIKHIRSALTVAQVRRIRRLYPKGFSYRDLAKMFLVSPSTIKCVVRRLSYVEVV